MQKKFITPWRITVVTVAAILFVQLFNTFGAATDAVLVGRVSIPQTYLQQTTMTTTQLTYK